jgi:hypothetical protein
MRKVVIIALLSLFLISCRDNNVEEPNDTPEELSIQDYFPLTENTKYTYKGTGNEFASYTVYVDYLDGQRIQTRTNNGGSELVRVLELNDAQLRELFFRGETYFRENFIDDEYSTGKTLLEEPLEVGNSWSREEGSTSTITSINKEVVTPEGNVQAIEVTTESKQGTTIEYYAKNKGLVKVINKGDGFEVTSTLQSIENNVPLIQTVTLFYPDINGINLRSVDVQVSFNTNDEPKTIIENTIRDLSVFEMISPNTKINELYFDKDDNSVHVDLSKEFVTEMNAGAGFESLILKSIANTLGTYYGVQNIFLTIDGKPYESGHILLEEGEPLTVDYSIVIE